MFGPMQRTAGNPTAAYTQVGVETGVGTADPHRLILMLFDGALLCVASAHQHMQAQNFAAKGESISKAINIVANGLKVSLDMSAGGELAGRLAALYDYMCERLIFANLKNNPAVLDEVRDLLHELKGAWEGIGSPDLGQPKAA